MVQPPGAAQAAEGALDALAEGGTGEVGALAAGVGEQGLGIAPAQRRQRRAQGPLEVGGDGGVLGRGPGVGTGGEGGVIMLAAAAAPLAQGADLVGGDAQRS